MQKAYRYRVYPTSEQETLLRRTMGCARLVYNRALASRTEGWYERQEKVDYIKTSAMLTQWKKQEDLQFLNEVSCVPLQQGLRHLQKAFANFWAGHAKYPNFKKKHNGGSAEFTKSAFKWKDGQVWLAKCTEALPIRWSRQLPKGCEPSTITVKLDASGRFHVSLLVDTVIEPLPKSNKSIGLDMGITSLIATSNGDKIANPKHFKRRIAKLRRVQKSLSRKQKGSNNRHKQRLKVAKVHGQITDSRKDFLHKLTTQLVNENQTIVVEDLAIKNMVKNHKLALSISDASWGEFVRQLAYKCEWHGRELIKIDRWFPSSKRCGNCGHIVDKMPLNVREWDCPKCQTNHDRDINASRNILAAGLAVSVCGANIRPDRQESKRQLQKTRKGKKQKPKS
ncbi:RNA-guided endonuclease InsQ/TnpB family protein [Synechocystis sp. PCC 7509]|uniref:RNA-guided endonuclease InsQ/TnpB family protein n=1 Tax=Synechocystis sp. PCC 7509 TaxID=927677 RepID=UPI00048ACF8A|nr:RNA-guided endonuclease TnpB family protein [Synechocystis sp. PCC 7509]